MTFRAIWRFGATDGGGFVQFLICVRGDSQGQSVLRALSQEDTKDMAAILIPTCYGTRAFCLATAGVVYAQTLVLRGLGSAY